MKYWIVIFAGLLSAVLIGCDGTPLEIQTKPPGAEVYFDSTALGASPCETKVPSSKDGFPELHVIEARLSGYKPGYHYFNSPGNSAFAKPQTVVMTLDKLPAGQRDISAAPVTLFNAAGEASSGAFFHFDATVVRIKDRRVMAYASVYASARKAKQAAELLANQLKAQMSTRWIGPLAMGPIRNRRNSRIGRELDELLRETFYHELLYGCPLGMPTQIDLRMFIKEDGLDNPDILRHTDLKNILKKYGYIVLTGLAEASFTQTE